MNYHEKVSKFTVEKVNISNEEEGIKITYAYGEYGVLQSLVLSNTQLEILEEDIDELGENSVNAKE